MSKIPKIVGRPGGTVLIFNDKIKTGLAAMFQLYFRGRRMQFKEV
jgi:hypothetical protein